ncbi:predicted protein [Histoplasma capsulatum G186AR]|uniref:Uncharacterized protein n=1 Tax=Ajellomyces capsulatus (strain G186AR / H82 / ATCC MYA-2454 / RMSCC 2432) TaxID=447093 RepID=C0NFF1_AJECG|nr:uncharacterized protein HCBG_01617 [Histoplasma capsulatum G186AR]EEH09972.1 predicted protein [Histoplasma capsulatum G186AR]
MNAYASCARLARKTRISSAGPLDWVMGLSLHRIKGKSRELGFSARCFQGIFRNKCGARSGSVTARCDEDQEKYRPMRPISICKANKVGLGYQLPTSAKVAKILIRFGLVNSDDSSCNLRVSRLTFLEGTICDRTKNNFRAPLNCCQQVGIVSYRRHVLWIFDFGGLDWFIPTPTSIALVVIKLFCPSGLTFEPCDNSIVEPRATTGRIDNTTEGSQVLDTFGFHFSDGTKRCRWRIGGASLIES